ncbi:MAG: 3-phosphoshikimate 1-carboxyvinyltransferase [Pseudanabaenaceae cyanobacterium]
MLVTVPQHRQGLRGTLKVAGDKSISHRALMLGALAEGTTTIQGLLLGDDPLSTAECLQAMGAQISPLNEKFVEIKGIGADGWQEPADVLNAGNSGTTIRLLLGILASQPRRFFVITGDCSLRRRPMKRVIHPLQAMGAQIWCRAGGYAPLAVQGQSLKGIEYQSPIASAQVKSCILLAGLFASGETVVTEPSKSRDHSERMLNAFGADISVDGNTVRIQGGIKLRGQAVLVPGDISSAAFWLVAGTVVPDSELLIQNVGVNPTRTGILEVLQAMGADIQLENERVWTGEPVADIRVRSASLKACNIGGAMIPRLLDEIPILSIACACAEGTSIIQDAQELRVKESDRVAVMARALAKIGVQVQERPDGLEITGGNSLQGAEIDSQGDHRIAMSLAIAGLVSAGEMTIANAECATVSYPNFFTTLGALGVKMRER